MRPLPPKWLLGRLVSHETKERLSDEREWHKLILIMQSIGDLWAETRSLSHHAWMRRQKETAVRYCPALYPSHH